MTKLELMAYSWSRDFSYDDLLHVAGMMTDAEVPSQEEYMEYSKQAFEEMLKFMDREYEDRQANLSRIRRELGWELTENEDER